MILAHKIALDPAPEQAVYFARAAGTARFAWNWALGRWQEEYALWKEYQCGPKPSEAFLRRELNALKEDAFPVDAGGDEKRAAAGHQDSRLGIQELL
jgi:putative transposase